MRAARNGLGFVVSQIREIEDARQKRLEQQPETGPHAMVRRLACVFRSNMITDSGGL
jgi:hypothetical protein